VTGGHAAYRIEIGYAVICSNQEENLKERRWWFGERRVSRKDFMEGGRQTTVKV
jgi:hypothetical protein